MYDAVYVEQLNKPAVALVNENFMYDARSAASSKGLPTVRVLASAVPCECINEQIVEPIIDSMMDDIIKGLTKPLSPQEESPEQPKVEETPRIIFKGNLQEINRFFYKRGWADGLPIIPPTEEAVKEMLTGTDLPADHILGKIVPRRGKATVEKVAINAVMAGALPTYMPVLIAGVEALLDPESFFHVWGVSTGSWAPFWIFNGPIRKDLNINYSSGTLSPGNIANATIGRSMALIIKNIGGARPGIEDMGVLGNTGKYSMVMAENEEANPWGPLHVENGLHKDDSAVSLIFPNSSVPVFPGTDYDGLLNSMIHSVTRRGLTCIVLNPAHAKTLFENGWTKEEIITYITQFARVPAYRNPSYHKAALIKIPKAYRVLNEMESSPVIENPAWIRIIVAGGPGNFIGIYAGGRWPGNEWVTKKVNLPANWGSLVKKYKDVVPNYAFY
ncbi:MAG: hypothetical protein A2W25_15670 [candidate division Zixibacteria bacterium RBG_16_53_22]|nr:MAG: hypothetical protein A2W25_15670 [candidate division Zixibacteria bacterium RBG_16_53_22]HJX12612.1 hypothetical protein [Dehalococcoidales bacterium]